MQEKSVFFIFILFLGMQNHLTANMYLREHKQKNICPPHPLPRAQNIRSMPITGASERGGDIQSNFHSHLLLNTISRAPFWPKNLL